MEDNFQPKRYFLRITFIEAHRASFGGRKGAWWHTFLVVENTGGKDENEFRRVEYGYQQDDLQTSTLLGSAG